MSDSSIKMAVQKLAGTFLKDEITMISCSVESVNVGARTCNCVAIDGEGVTEVINVQLMAEVDDGMLLVPTVGSTVMVAFSKRVLPFVVMFSQLDQIVMISGSSVVTIQDGSIQFNDGSFGGLIKISQLVTKLNNLENDLNKIKQAFTSWTPVPNDGGSALKVASATWAGAQLVDTMQSDLENTLVTHGQ